MENNYVTRIFGNARFKPRSDLLENWERINPVLLSGEAGVVIDGTETEKIKFGDGITPWNELGWWKGPKGEKGDTGHTGPQGPQGLQGETYVLQAEDKVEIVSMVLEKFTDVAVNGQ